MISGTGLLARVDVSSVRESAFGSRGLSVNSSLRMLARFAKRQTVVVHHRQNADSRHRTTVAAARQRRRCTINSRAWQPPAEIAKASRALARKQGILCQRGYQSAAIIKWDLIIAGYQGRQGANN